jgi:hypothetical protein
MKTKVFFMLCFLLCIGLTQLSAQKKTVKFSGEFDYWQPVYCNGVYSDTLIGKTIYEGVELVKDSVIVWQNFHNRGTATSIKTGEVFVVEEKDKQYPDVTFVIWNFNLKGDQGSHYLGSMTWNWTSGEITVDKFVCVVNKKK